MLPIVPRRLLLLALACAPAVAPAAAQEAAMLEVRVASTTGEPIGDAVVSVPGAGVSGRTDAGGGLRLYPVPEGMHFVEVTRLGFRAETFRVELRAGWVDRWNVEMEPAPIPLAGVTAVGDPASVPQLHLLRGFYERRALGRGFFMTRAEIDGHGSRDLMNVLRSAAGFHATSTRFGQADMQIRGSPFIAGGCEPRVYMDGMVYRWGEEIAGMSTLDLEAIEVYRGRSELPGEFADPEANCGVIVLWSRRYGGGAPG